MSICQDKRYMFIINIDLYNQYDLYLMRYYIMSLYLLHRSHFIWLLFTLISWNLTLPFTLILMWPIKVRLEAYSLSNNNLLHISHLSFTFSPFSLTYVLHILFILTYFSPLSLYHTLYLNFIISHTSFSPLHYLSSSHSHLRHM